MGNSGQNWDDLRGCLGGENRVVVCGEVGVGTAEPRPLSPKMRSDENSLHSLFPPPPKT